MSPQATSLHSQSERKILFALYCCPGDELWDHLKIAALSGLSPRTVIPTLARLVAAGEVIYEPGFAYDPTTEKSAPSRLWITEAGTERLLDSHLGRAIGRWEIAVDNASTSDVSTRSSTTCRYLDQLPVSAQPAAISHPRDIHPGTPKGWALDSPLFRLSSGYGEVGLVVCEVFGVHEDDGSGADYLIHVRVLAEITGYSVKELNRKIKAWSAKGMGLLTMDGMLVHIKIPPTYHRELIDQAAGAEATKQTTAKLTKLAAKKETFRDHRATKFRSWAMERELQHILASHAREGVCWSPAEQELMLTALIAPLPETRTIKTVEQVKRAAEAGRQVEVRDRHVKYLARQASADALATAAALNWPDLESGTPKAVHAATAPVVALIRKAQEARGGAVSHDDLGRLLAYLAGLESQAHERQRQRDGEVYAARRRAEAEYFARMRRGQKAESDQRKQQARERMALRLAKKAEIEAKARDYGLSDADWDEVHALDLLSL